ncbi:dihydrodipicolinate synthase family protein [bacterium]|nr:dihydrodipicolinate synthase family protein [bacterium]
MELKGILPPVPTPFINGDLVLRKLTDNLTKWNSFDLAGYLILGSNGEAVMLNDNEKFQVLETARTAIPKNKIMMAGANADSTKETITFINKAGEIGADCALVITPFYYKESMTQEILYQHFRRVADGVKIPILLYNVPQFTGVNLAAETVARLSDHPNIVGLKDSSGNMGLFADHVALVPKSFACFVGNAPTLLTALTLGAAGGILAVANVLPEECIQITKMFGQNRMDEARQLQFDINPIARAVTSKYGIGGLKAALDLIGFFGGDPRSPLMYPDEKIIDDIRVMMRK